MNEMRQEIDLVIKVYLRLLNFMDASPSRSYERAEGMELEKHFTGLFKRLADASSEYLGNKHQKLREVLPHEKLADCLTRKIKNQSIDTQADETFEKIATCYRNGHDLIGDFYKLLFSICHQYFEKNNNLVEFKNVWSHFEFSKSAEDSATEPRPAPLIQPATGPKPTPEPQTIPVQQPVALPILVPVAQPAAAQLALPTATQVK